jgi:Holliday junction resolvase RusA-like endonuclease
VWPITINLAGLARGKGAGRAAIGPNGSARVYTDAKTRKYESQLRFAAQQQMGDNPPTAQPVAVHIEVRFAVPTSWSKKKRLLALAGRVAASVKPDCNNFSKALDGLNGIVWLDDKQIVLEHIEKRYAEAPGLTIRIATVVPPEPQVVVSVKQKPAKPTLQADFFL